MYLRGEENLVWKGRIRYVGMNLNLTKLLTKSSKRESSTLKVSKKIVNYSMLILQFRIKNT